MLHISDETYRALAGRIDDRVFDAQRDDKPIVAEYDTDGLHYDLTAWITLYDRGRDQGVFIRWAALEAYTQDGSLPTDFDTKTLQQFFD